MSGTAMFTIVASTNAMKLPSTATVNTVRGDETRRVRAGAAVVPVTPKGASLCQAWGAREFWPHAPCCPARRYRPAWNPLNRGATTRETPEEARLAKGSRGETAPLVVRILV